MTRRRKFIESSVVQSYGNLFALEMMALLRADQLTKECAQHRNATCRRFVQARVNTPLIGVTLLLSGIGTYLLRGCNSPTSGLFVISINALILAIVAWYLWLGTQLGVLYRLHQLRRLRCGVMIRCVALSHRVTGRGIAMYLVSDPMIAYAAVLMYLLTAARSDLIGSARPGLEVVGPLLILGAWVLYRMMSMVLMRRRTLGRLRNGRCPACGYELTMEEGTGRCPECGLWRPLVPLPIS